MTEKNFRDKLIFARDAGVPTMRESGESRVRAARHQEVPLYELNSAKLSNHKGPRPEGYSVRDQHINPIRRQKGLPTIEQ